MAVFSFPYTRYSATPSASSPATKFIDPPVVLTTLVVAGRKASCHAVVDSGADCCLFPSLLLRKLELKSAALPLESSSGVGASNKPTHYADVSVELHGVGVFPARAEFTEGLNDWGVGLLGHLDFFERFRVSFDFSGGYFNIETK
ncbi:MAG: hypothetical protein WA823_15415 [Candidatus Acidiferrales bacterium]